MAIFERLCTRQNSKPTLANSVGYWVNFNCCKWPNREQTIQSSGHTAFGAKKEFIRFYLFDWLQKMILEQFFVNHFSTRNVNCEMKMI